jgi:hypothetical protein
MTICEEQFQMPPIFQVFFNTEIRAQPFLRIRIKENAILLDEISISG